MWINKFKQIYLQIYSKTQNCVLSFSNISSTNIYHNRDWLLIGLNRTRIKSQLICITQQTRLLFSSSVYLLYLPFGFQLARAMQQQHHIDLLKKYEWFVVYIAQLYIRLARVILHLLRHALWSFHIQSHLFVTSRQQFCLKFLKYEVQVNAIAREFTDSVFGFSTNMTGLQSDYYYYWTGIGNRFLIERKKEDFFLMFVLWILCLWCYTQYMLSYILKK